MYLQAALDILGQEAPVPRVQAAASIPVPAVAHTLVLVVAPIPAPAAAHTLVLVVAAIQALVEAELINGIVQTLTANKLDHSQGSRRPAFR